MKYLFVRKIEEKFYLQFNYEQFLGLPNSKDHSNAFEFSSYGSAYDYGILFCRNNPRQAKFAFL